MTHLQEDFHGSAIQQWHTARTLRKDFRPTPTNLINTEGKLVSKAARAETFADYLANQVWKAPDDESKPFSPPLEEIPASARPFTMEELNIVFRALGKRKALGPDAIPAELLQNAPYVFRLYLLDHYNHCLQQGKAPLSWLHSEVGLCLLKTIKKIQSFFRTIDSDLSPLLTPCIRFTPPSCKKDWQHILIIASAPRNLALDRAGRLPNLFIYFAAYWRCTNAKLRRSTLSS